MLPFEPFGADHLSFSGISVFPCNPILCPPFEAMAEIPERLFYLRCVGSLANYQFSTIFRQTGSTGCWTKYHPGRFPRFRDLRGVGIGKRSGYLFRASVFDDLLIPGVTPLVVGGFPLCPAFRPVLLRNSLFCSRGRDDLFFRFRCFFRRIKRQFRLYCRGSSLCGLSRGFGDLFLVWRSS